MPRGDRITTPSLCKELHDLRARIKPPLHAMHTPITIRRDLLEQRRAEIDASIVAATARVDDLGLVCRALVADGDVLAAQRVGVRVCAVLHHAVWDGDDVVGVSVCPAARAHAHIVVRDVACVGGASRGGAGASGSGRRGACGSWSLVRRWGFGGNRCDVGGAWGGGGDVDGGGAWGWCNIDRSAAGRLVGRWGLVAGRRWFGRSRAGFNSRRGRRWNNSHGRLDVRCDTRAGMVIVAVVARAASRDTLARVDPYGGRHRDRNHRLVGLGDPNYVAFGHRHGRDNREERAGGDHVLGVHFRKCDAFTCKSLGGEC
jgi:hypothetical protein